MSLTGSTTARGTPSSVAISAPTSRTRASISVPSVDEEDDIEHANDPLPHLSLRRLPLWLPLLELFRASSQQLRHCRESALCSFSLLVLTSLMGCQFVHALLVFC
mmetsp:Transcript_161528/g.518622  ORF Transcript_161528/g.518622 Transcript_161528/m.518622 type:complete len:105 (-) Transcript_161528:288-602(-)